MIIDMKMNLSVLLSFAMAMTAGAQGVIIDHNCTDVSWIPDAWINQAKANLRVHYAHTSHGSQLMTGAEVLESQDAKYNIAVNYSSLASESGALCFFDGQEGETYITPELYWESTEGLQYTRDVLTHNPSINVSMWAWCGQVSSYSAAQINNYLAQISALETEFPGVRFVYFTGHLDGGGSSGTLNQNNNIIRNFCRTYNKTLFDFADIERFDPNGTDYLDLGGGTGGDGDGCQYNSGNWGVEWCDANPGSPLCADCSCAHSQPLNCNLKGRAMWWLMARIAGWSGSEPVYPGTGVFNDFDGDTNADIAVFRPATATWYRWGSKVGGMAPIAFGAPGDLPVSADYDGDLRMDMAIFRPSIATWYVSCTTAGARSLTYGAPTDIPVPADYDKDGRADVAVFRPSTATWYIRRSTLGPLTVTFGGSTDLPAPADFDGDHQADFAVFRPSTATWYVWASRVNALRTAVYGAPGDIPVPADYDGDGRADRAVFRKSNAGWYILRTAKGPMATSYGTPTDIPVR
jgi:hypothetical protein